MSEIGESAELIDELFMESAKADKAKQESPGWHRKVALSSLVLALLTALGGLLAGLAAHESLLERTKEIIEISQLEGDHVRAEVLLAKHEILVSLGQEADPEEIERLQSYREEERELAREVFFEEFQVQLTNFAHIILAVAVTVLSVAITLSGMAVVVEEKSLWLIGLMVGAVGVIALVVGIIIMVN